MLLTQSLSTTLAVTPPEFDQFSDWIDAQWIQSSLQATGKASIRKRKLPAEHVVWLVIGLALFRNQPIWYVVQELQLMLGGQPLCVPSASVQARQRLGSEPLKHLFFQLSQLWQTESQASVSHTFHGLSVCAVDGVIFSTQHTTENITHFGSSQGKDSTAPYPQVRAVCLVNTDSHEIMDVRLGNMQQGELTLADELCAPARSVTLFDRAYFSAAFLCKWQASHPESHWLMRAKDNLRYEVVKRYATGDEHIRMPTSPRAQKLHPHLAKTWDARLIVVQQGGRTRRYITSLMDAKTYPKHELAALYQQRWEIELCYREIKADLQDGLLLRSKQPDLVYQELWGVLIAYNLLRRQIKQMAQQLKISPLRMSFHIASIAIINLLRFAPLASAGTIPKQLDQLMKQAHLFVIPERRKRNCPRQVKGRPAKYPKKHQSVLN
jgi:hypothetical protein